MGSANRAAAAPVGKRHLPVSGPEYPHTVSYSGLISLGYLLIGLFFGVFGLWSALAPLESAAIAPGVVAVDTSRKTIQHLEGGIVREILVREGQRVEAGQVLLRLDDTQPGATLRLLSDRMTAARAREARLLAERDGLESIVFSEQLLQSTAEGVIVAERNLFLTRREALEGKIAILRQRNAQSTEEINGLKAKIKTDDRQLALIGKEIEGLRKLVDAGLARKPRLLELKRLSAGIEGARHQNAARIAQIEQRIGEAEMQITEVRSSRQNEIAEQLRQVQAERLDLSERMKTALDIVRRTNVVAPQDGAVVGLQVHTVGGVIAPGSRLMDIVPSDERLVVEARIDPADIDVLYTGLPARVRFAAFSRRNQTPLRGVVASVSADRLADGQTGDSYYLARVELLDPPAGPSDAPSLFPGMQAEVIVVTGRRTALDYLTQPLLRSFDRALRED